MTTSQVGKLSPILGLFAFQPSLRLISVFILLKSLAKRSGFLGIYISHGIHHSQCRNNDFFGCKSSELGDICTPVET